MADGVLLAAEVAPTSDAEIAFRQQIAPVLEARCVGCHRGVAARADLSLDARDGLIRGGESGPAIIPGKPDESLLVEMISGDEPSMPKDAPRLAAAEVEAIREWIASGAAWPADLVLQDKREGAPGGRCAPSCGPKCRRFAQLRSANRWLPGHARRSTGSSW